MKDLDQLATSMPLTTKEVTEDGRPAYFVHGKLFCFHRGRRPDAIDPETRERRTDVLMFRVEDLGVKELHQWLFPLKAFRELHGEEGGEVNASSPVVEGWFENVGATVMGRNMFGGGPGPWGENPWKGWWGEDPPFHHPVFVLTHHPR